MSSTIEKPVYYSEDYVNNYIPPKCRKILGNEIKSCLQCPLEKCIETDKVYRKHKAKQLQLV